MTHLRIEQSTGVIEEVNLSIISKLYELAYAGLDASSNLLGRLHTPISYRSEVQYLTTNFPNLYITSDDYAIPFEDPNMVTYLNNLGVGSNGMITESLAAAATVVANNQNTEVTKFNELKYFTNVTESRGGWTDINSGWVQFRGWTALQEVDISNFTSLGHKNGYGWEDTFYGCTSLTTVKASDKLVKIGNHAFNGCNNLLSITGLDGVIEIYGQAFCHCTKLPSSVFANCLIKIVGGDSVFAQCNELTTITLSNDCTSIPYNCFYNCNKLTTVVSPGVTSIGYEAFRSCTKLANINLSNVITIGSNAFYEDTSLTSIDLSNCTSIGNSAFESCTGLTSVTGLNNITTIGNQAFKGCSNLQSVDINWSNITKLGFNAFRNCSNLGTNLTLEINLTNLTGHFGSAFRGTKFKKIIFHVPSEVLGDQNNEPLFGLEYTEYIDASDFPLPVVNGRTLTTTNRDNNLITCIYPSNTNFLEALCFKCAVGTYRYMIILSTTPPGLKTDDNNNPTSSWLPQGSTLHIYVPDSAKASYLADTDWASITGTSGDTIVDRLHGLSELPAGVWTTGLASLYLSAAQLVTS